jgi:hypothetical protein
VGADKEAHDAGAHQEPDDGLAYQAPTARPTRKPTTQAPSKAPTLLPTARSSKEQSADNQGAETGQADKCALTAERAETTPPGC